MTQPSDFGRGVLEGGPHRLYSSVLLLSRVLFLRIHNLRDDVDCQHPILSAYDNGEQAEPALSFKRMLTGPTFSRVTFPRYSLS